MTQKAQTLGIAVVTGASRGIGAACALRLAQVGYFVVVNFQTNSARAQEVLTQITQAGGKGALLGFDVSDSTAVDAAFEKVAKEWVPTHGPLSVLVNNAGITMDQILVRLKDEDLDRVIDIDLKGAIYCTRAATKQMMRSRQGSVIQISSVIAEMGNTGQSAYAAAKAGLMGFSKSVARELGSRNVRVNVIAPGFIETEMTVGLTEAQKEAILRNVPLGCLGDAQDVAHLVSFLAGNQSRYITGQVIGLNGGLYM